MNLTQNMLIEILHLHKLLQFLMLMIVLLFLMYESMAATWFLYKKKIQEPRIQTAYRNQEDNVTQEVKDFVLEKFMYELRQWKTIDQPSKQLYHSKHFKEFVDFWGLAVT